MPASYIGTAIYHPVLQLPRPGDGATAASVNEAAFKYLSDNTAFLKARTDVLVDGGLIPATYVQFGGAVGVPSGPLTVGGNFAVLGSNSYLYGSAFIGKTLTVASGISVAGDAQFDGAIRAVGKIQGRYPVVSRVDADALINRNELAIAQNFFGAALWTYSIDPTGQQPGDWIHVVNTSAAGTCAVNGSSGNIGTLTTNEYLIAVLALNTASQPQWFCVASGDTTT